MDSWMSDLPEAIKKRRLNRITIPTTHDSGAYKLNLNVNPPYPEPYDKAYFFGKWPVIGSFYVKPIVANWTLAQSIDIYDQLMLGIRGFDLRIVFLQNTFYIAHSFVCTPLLETLDGIARFLQTHPDEVLRITWKADHVLRRTISGAVLNTFFRLLETHLKEYLIPAETDYPTLEQALDAGNIITFWSSSLRGVHTKWFIWPKGMSRGSGWINTSDPTQKLKIMSEKMRSFKDLPNVSNSLSFTLTPQKGDVIKDVFARIFLFHSPRTLLTLGQEMQSRLPNFASENNMSLVSTISTDDPQEDFVRFVVNLNTDIDKVSKKIFGKQ
jgi:hypothetical protein